MNQSGYIGSEELFGKASRLIAEGGVADICGVSSLGIGYQLLIATLAILFIYVITRYADALLYLSLSAVSSKIRHSSSHTFTGEIRNIENYAVLLGVTTIALLAMRYASTNALPLALAPYTDINIWGLGGITFGGVALLLALQRLLLRVVGFVCERPDIEKGLWRIKIINFSGTTIFTIPALLMVLLSEGIATQIALYYTLIVYSISIILLLKETFLFFRTQRVSIFHWILYLCTLEILPLSLLVAPIARGWVYFERIIYE